MSTEIATLNDVFGEMGLDLAEALGFGDINTTAQSNMPELMQLFKAVKGEMEVKGRKMTVETIPGGYYKLKLPDNREVYSDAVTVRIFMQRFFYQRYEKFAVPVDDKQGRMHRTTMAISLSKGDLKDSYGKFNCGRPGGFIKDYDSLSGPLRDIVKNTKRVMAVFGLVKLNNPTDVNGNPVELDWQPFTMNIKNRYSYKSVEDNVKAIMKNNRLPIQYLCEWGASSELLPNGENNYWINGRLLEATTLQEGDQQLMRDFVEYVEQYNRTILSMWDRANSKDMSQEDKDFVEGFVNIEDADFEETEAA